MAYTDDTHIRAMPYVVFRRGSWAATFAALMGSWPGTHCLARCAVRRSWIACALVCEQACDAASCSYCALSSRTGPHHLTIRADAATGTIETCVDEPYVGDAWVFVRLQGVADRDVRKWWETLHRAPRIRYNYSGVLLNFLLPSCLASPAGLLHAGDDPSRQAQLFCSELVVGFLQTHPAYADLPLVACQTTPQMLYDALLLRGNHTQYLAASADTKQKTFSQTLLRVIESEAHTMV